MTVQITSPVLGQPVGADYTGPLEDWLLAEGYAKRDGYTGPGVSNTGPTDVAEDDDPTVAANREDPHWPGEGEEGHNATIANDADNLNEDSFPHEEFDFDPGGVDDDEPVVP